MMQHVETICDTFGGGWQFGSASRDAGHPGANLLLPMIYDAWPVVQPGKIEPKCFEPKLLRAASQNDPSINGIGRFEPKFEPKVNKSRYQKSINFNYQKSLILGTKSH
jgi:hypothetical protein